MESGRGKEIFHFRLISKPFYTYSWKLNPRAVDAHLEYWLATLFGPINGILILLSFVSERVAQFRSKFFCWGLTILAINALPGSWDRVKILFSDIDLKTLQSFLSVVGKAAAEPKTYYWIVHYPFVAGQFILSLFAGVKQEL